MHRYHGGMYGFVRSTSNLPDPPYYEIFHEGIDIRPVRRDARGEPLDPVRAAADGVVVYANTRPGKSNYGNYLMIQHDYPDGTAYTTYAHLARIQVPAGQKVKAGDVLGLMGHTGAGINCERAHLHFEFGFRLLPNYCEWHDHLGVKLGEEGTNEHGEYNGLNYLGVNAAPLLQASAQGHPLTFKQIFALEHVLLRVRVPAARDFFYWQKCWPWMVQGGLQQPLPTSWDIDCDAVGIPLKFTPSAERVSQPVLIWFDNNASRQESFTRGLVETRGGKRQLSRHGLKCFSQLTYVP